MKIAILGAGGIGGSLGRLWAAAGHRVTFASRHPDRLANLAARAGHGAQAGTPAQAMEGADVVLDALPYAASLEIDPDAVAGKVVITASNYYPARDGEIDLGGSSQSGAVAARLPDARVVKAFNMMRAGEIEARANCEERPALAIYVAGDDADAKRIASDLVTAACFAPVDAGALADGAVFEQGAPLYDLRVSEDEARARLSEHRP